MVEVWIKNVEIEVTQQIVIQAKIRRWINKQIKCSEN